MTAFQSRSGGCCCGFLTLNRGEGGGVKCSCSRFGAVLDDARNVAGKRTYFQAVVVVM